MPKPYEKYTNRDRVNFEDDLVIVFEGVKEVYRGLEDYEPMKDEDWKWDETTRTYRLDKYIKICIN